MKAEASERRVRPIVVIGCVCAIAVIGIPVWLLYRPAPGAEAPDAVVMAQNKARAARARRPPAVAQPVTAQPRGAAVSKRATTPKPADPPRPASASPANLEQRWGIRVNGARLAMGNAFVDVRYEVTDTQKASLLSNGTMRAYLFDPASGSKLFMPAPPKEGAFPPTGYRLATGKVYFAVAGNPHGLVKSGSKVDLVVGDAKTTDLLIE